MHIPGIPSIPVLVLTGPLGAGKTTLLRTWLGERGREDVAVIVNELGAVGIDAELLRDRARALVEVTGGCVCCTTHAELVSALRELSRSRPRRIVVETSGAASPAGVVRAVLRTSERDALDDEGAGGLRLEGVVTVVDPGRTSLEPRGPLRPLAEDVEDELVAEQIGYADVVVLSHADEHAPEVVARARRAVAARNAVAIVTTARRGVLDRGDRAAVDDRGDRAAVDDRGDRAAVDALEDLLGRDGPPLAFAAASGASGGASGEASRDARGVHGERGAAVESIALSLAGEVDEDRFGDWIEGAVAPLGGRLLRMKGILAVAGIERRMILQGVTDRIEVTFGAPFERAESGGRSCRLVLIGYALPREELEAGFAACAAPFGVTLPEDVSAGETSSFSLAGGEVKDGDGVEVEPRGRRGGG